MWVDLFILSCCLFFSFCDLEKSWHQAASGKHYFYFPSRIIKFRLNCFYPSRVTIVKKRDLKVLQKARLVSREMKQIDPEHIYCGYMRESHLFAKKSQLDFSAKISLS